MVMVKNPNLWDLTPEEFKAVMNSENQKVLKETTVPGTKLEDNYTVGPNSYTVKPVEEVPSDMMTLATEIAKMTDALQQVVGSGLQKRTIVLLLCDQTKLGVATVTKVVDAMLNMKTHWTKLK